VWLLWLYPGRRVNVWEIQSLPQLASYYILFYSLHQNLEAGKHCPLTAVLHFLMPCVTWRSSFLLLIFVQWRFLGWPVCSWNTPCLNLDVAFWLASIMGMNVEKWNHKVVGVEQYHKFLNHDHCICAEECRTPESFVECSMWASAAPVW